jgi:hypothetical protein
MNPNIDPNVTPTIKLNGLLGRYNIANLIYQVVFQEITDDHLKTWFGYNTALRNGLIPGKLYTINMINIDRFATDISLQGIDGEYDSCMFRKPDGGCILSSNDDSYNEKFD